MIHTLETTITHPLPAYGKMFRGGRAILFSFLLACIAFGIYGYAQQRIHGDIVTGMRTIGSGGASWGLYIAFDIILAGLAFSGIAVATLSRIFRLRDLRPFSRIALLMAVISLALAGLCVLADLGRPFHGLMNLPRYARTMSPFFGTFTMIICGGLTASAVHLFISGRADAAFCAQEDSRLRWFYKAWASGFKNTAAEVKRHRVATILLSLVVFPLVVIAYSTLGFVFGIQSGRPGWFSALAAPGFVVLAAISGTGLLLFIAGRVRLMGFNQELPAKAFRWLSNALWVMLLVYLYFVAVEELTGRYAALQAQTEVAKAVDSGVYSGMFWGTLIIFVVCFLLLFNQFVRQAYSLRLMMTVGLLVNVGAVFKRFLIVVPSQTHGTLLPYPVGSYFPTWVEYSVIVGLIALGTLAFLVFPWIFPIVPFHPMGPVEMPSVTVRNPARKLARLSLFAVTLASGITIAVAGLLLSARVGTESYLDPLVPFSPVIFIVGLVISLLSAVVYETLPRALAPPAEPS